MLDEIQMSAKITVDIHHSICAELIENDVDVEITLPVLTTKQFNSFTKICNYLKNLSSDKIDAGAEK